MFIKIAGEKLRGNKTGIGKKLAGICKPVKLQDDQLRTKATISRKNVK